MFNTVRLLNIGFPNNHDPINRNVCIQILIHDTLECNNHGIRYLLFLCKYRYTRLWAHTECVCMCIYIHTRTSWKATLSYIHLVSLLIYQCYSKSKLILYMGIGNNPYMEYIYTFIGCLQICSLQYCLTTIMTLSSCHCYRNNRYQNKVSLQFILQ